MNAQDKHPAPGTDPQPTPTAALADEPSGFVGDIEQEMDSQNALRSENSFSDLTPIYVSHSGHARLFSARRYGKLHTLKCLKEDFLLSPTYRQALAKEFDIGIQLDHPYICRTISKEEVEGLGTTIVMEHIDGETLDDCIKHGHLTSELAEKVARQLAEALDYMHSKQILHRDLKPSNIMVTFNGHHTKLIDFSLSDSDNHCVLKMPAGTTNYIAPEVTKEGYRPNMKADIYSFGVVLKQMAEVCRNSHLAHCAQLCMHTDPEKRPSSACEALASKPNILRPLLLPLALTLCCLLLAALVVISLLQPKAPHPQARKTERTCKKNAASLARNRKRLYLCTANEAGQGHSSAGLERFSHIEEVIGSNPIVPTSTAEPKRTHHQGAPAFSFHPYPPPAAARKLEIRNTDGEQQEEGFFGLTR